MKHALVVVLGLGIALLARASVSAYPTEHGPFFPQEKVAVMNFGECDILEYKGDPDDSGVPVLVYGQPPPSEAPQVALIAERSGPHGVAVQVSAANGRVLVPEVHVSDAPASHRPQSLNCADLNADGRLDFVATLWYAGNGLGACFYDRVLLLSSSDAYRVWVVPTMCPGPGDFVLLRGGRSPLLVSTTFIETRGLVEDERIQRREKEGKTNPMTPEELVEDERQWHSYWVYNLLAFQGGEVALANNRDARFPKWVWYTLKPNHKPVRSLSGLRKRQLLDAHGGELFREVRW